MPEPSPIARAAAASISDYLMLGCHHMTPEGREHMARIIDEELTSLASKTPSPRRVVAYTD